MYEGKKVIVVGASKSGCAASLLLRANGAYVTLFDRKEKTQFTGGLSQVEEAGVELCFGRNPNRQDILGCSIVVASPGVPFDSAPFEMARSLGIPVIGEVELGYQFAKLSKLIAITGTNGKTTTTALVGEILNRKYPDTVVAGNIGVAFCDTLRSPASDLVAVLELSSFQLEAIDTFKPAISCVLNITPDHLNRHKTMANYVACKERIFENADQDDIVILNYDDLVVREMAGRTKARTVFFSLKETLKEGVFVKQGYIVMRTKQEELPLIALEDIPIPGDHNIENVMAATAIAFYAGLTTEQIRDGIVAFKGVAHRIEFVGEFNGITYYNDSKGTNTDAAIRAINSMSQQVVLIAGGYRKDSDFAAFTQAFGEKVKFVVLVGETAGDIAKAAKEQQFSRFEHADTFEDAVLRAMKAAAPGDCVLLSPACASWDMFDNFEQRGDLFKSIVKKHGMKHELG